MNLDISGTTHAGTRKAMNEDRILVNGRLMYDGQADLVEQDQARCFVADGVGGNRAGDFASHFILERINLAGDLTQANYRQLLGAINQEFLSITTNSPHLFGSASTLTGLVIDRDRFFVVHCGDSQLWLFRNEILFKITTDHVLDENEPNSPITSFFGGANDNLNFEDRIFVEDSLAGDIFLLCSDGLFKSLEKKLVKSILSSGGNIKSKTRELMQNCLLNGADDNVSLILIGRRA